MARQKTETRLKNEEHRLTIRLSGNVSDKIDYLVESRQFETKVEFVRNAIDKLLTRELKKAHRKNQQELVYYEDMVQTLERTKAARRQYLDNKQRQNSIVHR